VVAPTGVDPVTSRFSDFLTLPAMAREWASLSGDLSDLAMM
jgi:hypothetical protein